MQGRIDVVRPDGLIEGWCWDEEAPETRLSVTVLIDGIEAGSALASLYREDLRLAKIGDGCHAFSFVTQTLPSSDKRTQNYTLAETESRRPFGEPLVVHNKAAISLDNRLIELETRNRFLASRLDEIVRHNERTSSAELFSVVGEFFARLAKDMQRGEPLSIDRRLGEITQAATNALAPLVFPVSEKAKMTILVQACVSLAQTHACLASLLRSGVGTVANVIVIDNGQVQDAVLLPSLVRGIRYVHTVASLTSEWMSAETTDHADWVLMLSGAAVVSEQFLPEMVAACVASTNAGAIGAHAARMGANGSLGGLFLVDGVLQDGANAKYPEAMANLDIVYPVHAISHYAAMFRRSALRSVGGLDVVFAEDLGAAVIDLCFRLRQAGWAVLADPLATIELQPAFDQESWISSGFGTTSHAAELLQARWFNSSVSHPPLYSGQAMVAGVAGEFNHELEAIRRLRQWGYSIEYLSVTGLGAEEVTDLRRAGAVLRLASDTGAASGPSDATLVYSATGSSNLEFRREGSEVLIGLAALEQFRTASSSSGITTDAEDFVANLPLRQVARL
jgi:hypothetical protein